MANRKPKTWKDVKAANAARVEREIRETALPEAKPRGAMAMLGFARRFRATRRSQDSMREIRGED